MSETDFMGQGIKGNGLSFDQEREFRRYVDFFEYAPIYCYRVSSEGIIIDVNRAALDFLEFKREELVGSPIETIYAPGSRDIAVELFRSMKEGGDIQNEEMEIQSKTGALRPVLLSATAHHIHEGSLIESILVQENISKLKTLEQELIEEKDRAARFLEIAGVMIIALDADGRVTLANRKAAEVLGCPSSEIIGRDWFENFLPERHKQSVKKVFNNLIEGNIDPVRNYVNKVLTADGTERLIEWHNSYVTDGGGRVTGIMSSGEDITDHQVMKGQLEKERDMMAGIADTVLDALVMIDDTATVQYWNKAAERIFGYTSEEAIGKPLPSLVVPEKYKERLTGGFTRFVETGEGPLLDRTVEMVAKRKDGSEFPVEHSIASVNIDGRWHAVGIIRDITERDAAEKKLAERVEELERFRKATVGREFKLHELKLEIEQLHDRIRKIEGN